MPEIDNQTRHSNAVWRALTSGKIQEATAMLREKGMESLSNPKLSILEDVLPLALQSLASSYDQHGIVGDEDRYFELARELWRFMSDAERSIPEMVCTFLYAGCKFNQPGFVHWILPIVASHPSIEMHALAADRQYQFNQLRHSAVYYIARNGNIELYDLLASACGGVSPLLLECAHYDAQALSVVLQGTATRPRGLSLGTSSLADAFSQDTMLAGTTKGGEAADPPSLYVALRAGQTAFARHCLASLPAQDQARVLRLTVVYGILPADDIDVAKALYAICCEPAQDTIAPHPVDMPRALAESPSEDALHAGPHGPSPSDTASVASQSGPASGGGGGGSTSALSPTVAGRLVETASCIFGFGAGRDVSQGPIMGIPRSRTVSEASVSLLSTISDTNTVASSAFPPTVTSATAPAPLLSSEAGTSLFSPFHCYAWHLCFFTSEGSAEPTVRRKRHAVRYAAWLLRTFRLAILQPLSRMRWSGATAILHPYHPSTHDVFGNSQGQQSGQDQHGELAGVRVRSSAVQASPSRPPGHGPGLPFAPPAYWSDWTPLHSAAAAPSPDLLQRLLAVDKGQLLQAAVGTMHSGTGTVELSEKDAVDAGEPSALKELYPIRVAVETCLWTAQFETPRVLAQWLTAPQLEVQLYCASRALGLAQAKPAFIKSLCKETGVLTMRPFKHGPIPIAGRDAPSGLTANPDAGAQQSTQAGSGHAPADRVVSPPPERVRTPVPKESPAKGSSSAGVMHEASLLLTTELAAEGRQDETGEARGGGRDPSPTDSPNLEVIAQSHGARAAAAVHAQAQAHSKQAAPSGSIHGAEAASTRHFRARGVSAGSLGSASTGTAPSLATKSAVGMETLVDTNSGGSGSRRGSSVSGTAEFDVLTASERQRQVLSQHEGHTGLDETDFQQVQSHKGKRKKSAVVALPPSIVTSHRSMTAHAKEKGSQAIGPVAQGSVIAVRAYSSTVVQEPKAHAERSVGSGSSTAAAGHSSHAVGHAVPPPPASGDKTDSSTSQRSLAVAGRSDEQNVSDVEEDKAAAAGQEMRDTLIAASVRRSRSVAGLAALSHSPERAMHGGAAGSGAGGSGTGASSTPKPARLTSAPSVHTVQDSAIAKPVPVPHAGRADEDETLIPQGSMYHSNSYMSPPRSVSSSVGAPEPSYNNAPSSAHHDRASIPPYRAGGSSQGSASDDIPSEASIGGSNLPLYDAISAGLDAALGLAPASRMALGLSSPHSAQQRASQQQQGTAQLQPVPFALPPVPPPAHRGDARTQVQGVTHPMGMQLTSPSLLKLTAASLLIEVDTSSSGLLSAACGPLRSNLYSGTIHGVACGVRGVDLRVTPLPSWYAHAVQALSVAWPSVVHVAGAAAAHVPAALRLQLTSASNTPLPGQARPIRCFCIATDSTGGGSSDGQQQAPTDLLWLVVEQCTHAQQLSASTLLMPSTPGLPPGSYSTRCKLVFELLSILSRYHASGIVHGCVQPGAVRVDPEGSVLLAHTFQAQAWLYGAIEVAEGALRSGKPPARAVHSCTARLSACLQGLLSYTGEWSAPETLAAMHEACDMATAVQSLGTPGRVTFAVSDEQTQGGGVQGSMQGQQESVGTAHARLQTMIGHAKAVLARLSSPAQDSYTAGLTAYTLLTGGAASNGHACGPAWARQAAILSGRHALSGIVGPGGTLTESGQVQARVLGLLPLHAMAVAALLAHNPADRAPVASVVQAFRV